MEQDQSVKNDTDKDKGQSAVERFVMYTCVVCGAETSTPKTLMHNSMHRYVCSTKCMFDFYQ